jgi:hypothetical protein
MDKSIANRITQLEKTVASLVAKRTQQLDVAPNAIKQRHLGESNIYIRTGLDANLPAVGETTTTGSNGIYFATDSFKLYIWTGVAWKHVTLS